MSSFFIFPKTSQKLLDTWRICWYILGCRCLLFCRGTEQTTQIRKGKNYVCSSSEFHAACLRRNRFRNHRIRHLWVHKRLRKYIPQRVTLRRSQNRSLSPKRYAIAGEGAEVLSEKIFTPLEIMPRSVSSPAIAGLEFLTEFILFRVLRSKNRF